jgi:hypothetical protein
MTEGMLTTLGGDQDRALRLMDEAIAVFRRVGEDFGLNNTLGMKSRVLIEEGRLDEARGVNVEFLQRSLDQNESTALSAAILDAASLEALAGDVERAARLFGAGQRAIDDAGGQQPPQLVRRVELMPLLKARLDDSTLAALVAEGRQMSNAAAVAYALESEP